MYYSWSGLRVYVAQWRDLRVNVVQWERSEGKCTVGEV